MHCFAVLIMHSYRMEKFLCLLLTTLILTGLYVPCNTFPSPASPTMASKTLLPPTPVISFFERLPEPERILQHLTKVQGESLNIEGFCSHQYIQAEKVWCKGDLLKECDPKEPFILSRSRWRYLTTDPEQRVSLSISGNGCLYFYIPALQIEDAGTYWIGILEDLHIVPLRKATVIVQNQHSPDIVQPPVEKDQDIHEDVGTPQCELSKKSLKSTTKEQEGQQNNGIVTTNREDDKRIYHLILVLGSTVVGITTIASLILVVTLLIKRKRRATHGSNFDANPKQTVITLQIREINPDKSPSAKEMNTLYAIPKKPKSRIEEPTYVNSQFALRSSIVKQPNKPDVLSSVETVEYANIEFESQHLRD